MMKDEDIYILFSNVAEHTSHDESVRKIFSMLIKSTLKYRDHMFESRNIIITVEDVRAALDWLVPCLKTGRLPKTHEKIRLDLLKLWLDELKYLWDPKCF